MPRKKQSRSKRKSSPNQHKPNSSMSARTSQSGHFPFHTKGVFKRMQIRELTGREKQVIRRLVKAMCANYDDEYGCLLLDSECFMFGKAYAGGALCKWFRAALLPLDPALERMFIGGTSEAKPCAVCGRAFPLNGRQTYCSSKCSKMARRKSVANSVKAYRNRKRRGVIN